MWTYCRYFFLMTVIAFALIFVSATSAELPANPRSEDDGQRDVAEILGDPGPSLVRTV